MKTETPISELLQPLREMRYVWRVAMALGLAIGLLGFTSTVYMLEVYDRVINSRDFLTLAMLTLLALSAYAVMDVLEIVRTRLFWGAGVRFDLAIKERIGQAMMDAMLRRRGVSPVMVMADLRSVREFFVNPAIAAAFEVPMSLLACVFIFLINPMLGWAALMGGALQTFVAWQTQRRSSGPLQEAQQHSQDAQMYAEAALRNAQVMYAMGMLEHIRQRWRFRQSAFLARQAQASEAASALGALSRLLQQLMGSVLLGMSAWLVIGGELAGGGAMMIISSVLGGRMLSPLVQMIAQWSSILTAFGAWKRLKKLLEEVSQREPAMPLPAPRGQLSVEQVMAAPPGLQTLVIRGVQFALEPGQVLAVIGPSAAGKTSLAKLILGIWASQAGKVRLDGVDIYGWNKEELGQYLGYLPQDVELTDGSIAQNIARFSELDMAKVREAAQRVGLHELIEALPQAYGTPVGRSGALLSGGMRQRVALARAFYGRPALIVLDEPNSSLDDAGDTALTRAIVQGKAMGTTFVINTHRRQILAVADRVLMLRDGAQQMFGPTEEVLQKLGLGATPNAANVPQASV
jgi:ATP-binding cassette, subfamily C, bacterial exporter for protease/lipase